MDVTPLPAPSATVETTPPRRRVERARTITEQIAVGITAAIVSGVYRDGERLREQELAALHGVSRGPVREAIRELAKHGIVVFSPRRGARVVGVSLDVVAEVFNIRMALTGVAARYFARRRPAEGLADMDAKLAQLGALAEAATVDPIVYARAVANCARSIYRFCGADHLHRILRDQYYSSIWGVMWRSGPLDYHTDERRRQALADWRALYAAACAGREREAERLFRKIQIESRDNVIATLAASRREQVDPVLVNHD
jgi:DNA-binding GntR family transcriptional regulator